MISSSKTFELRRCQPWLGTFVEVSATGGGEEALRRGVRAAFAAIQRVHHLMSFHDPDSEVTRLNGTVTKEAEMRFGSAWGVELHMDTPTGNVVERLILAGDGPRPRLYVYGVEGKNLTPTSPPCTKLFKSFRVNE